MPSVNLAVTAGARVYGAGGGAGASAYLPAGLWSGDIYRSFLKFAMPNWSALGVRRITSAVLKVKTSTENLVAFGSQPRVFVHRVVENWSEGTSVALSPSNAITWANQPAVTSEDNVDAGLITTSENVWVSIPITAIFSDWAPATVEGGSGAPNYGIRIRGYDETSTSRTTEFWSDDASSGDRPYIVLTYESNTAPSAPTALKPAADSGGNAVLASAFVVSGVTKITVSGTGVDIDPGDYTTAVRVQFFADSATDATPGSAIVDQTLAISTSSTGPSLAFSVAVPITALTIGTSYRGRVRTKDKAGVWGAWSSLTKMRFQPDTYPAPPSNTAVDIATQTPNFYGSIVDPDTGSTLSAARVVVIQDTSAGPITKWDSGFVAVTGTRFSIAYGGSTLDFGTKYRFAAQVKDQYGATSKLSAYSTWTPNAVAGPDNMTPRNVETKQNTLTPVLTIANASAFDSYELEVAKYGDGTGIMWDVPQTAMTSATSKAVTYAGSTLTWGRVFFWRANVRVGGVTWSGFSPWYPFYVNALPDPPVGSVDSSVDSGVGPYGEYSTVTSTTPTLRFPFSDPDIGKGYTEAPSHRNILIQDAASGTYVAGSPFSISSGITDTFAVPSGQLTSGHTYRATCNYNDSSGQAGPYSDPILFKCSTAYTITVGTSPSTTDPTPTFSWSNNRAQASFQVIVTEEATGEVVHDSGRIGSSATSYTMPGDILQSGVQYRYSVTSWDADSLSAVLA